jgi:hypothetical protein
LAVVRNSKSVENIAFRKLHLFLFSGGRRETPTLLGPLQRANLSHGTQHSRCLSRLKTNRFSFRNALLSSYLQFRTVDRVNKRSCTSLSESFRMYF